MMSCSQRRVIGWIVLLFMGGVFWGGESLVSAEVLSELPPESLPEMELVQTAEEHTINSTQPPMLEDFMEGWGNDARYEVDLISKETFSETLYNTVDYEQNYFRLVFSGSTGNESCAVNLNLIAQSRRFAKLVEQMRDGGPSQQQIDDLLSTMRKDIGKFEIMKAEDPEHGRSDSFGGAVYDPNLEDQSELVSGFARRMNVEDLLVGHFAIKEALPLVLESFDVRDGTIMKNWSSVMYACDKIMSSEMTEDLNKNQLDIRAKYLAWKNSWPENAPEPHWKDSFYYKDSFFTYKRIELPSYRALNRPHERATAMGAPVDYESNGTVEIEIPFFDLMAFDEYGMDAFREPRPHADVIAFARRFLEAAE